MIPLGLRITGREVPQKLVPHGSSLVVTLLGILENLLGLPNLQFVGLQFILGGSTLGPNSLLEIL
jgi:hypothetical protein